MAIEGLLDTDEERAAHRLIEQASTVLTGLRGDLPEHFAVKLFGRAAAEDLIRYDAREIAALAEDAWAFLKERRRDTPKIRCESRTGPAGTDGLERVTFLE